MLDESAPEIKLFMVEFTMKSETISIKPIGILHCSLKDMAETPKNYSESDHKGVIEILPEYLAGLDGIEQGQSITVLFWFNQANRDLLKIHPRGDKSKAKRGVFSTRSPARPNPIAISELQVLAIDQNRIEVMHVDALDQTPILDIKKTINLRS